MRPHVHLNCAVSLDGRLAGPDGPVRLSDQEDMRRVHRLRASSDAILVGINTVLSDDPDLGVKAEYARARRQPLRVVLDSRLRTPTTARVLRHPHIVFHAPDAPARADVNGVAVRPSTSDGGLDLQHVLRALSERGIKSLMVEGGGHVLRSFVDAGLWDVWTIYQAPVLLGDGPMLWPGGVMALEVAEVKPAGDGVLWRYVP